MTEQRSRSFANQTFQAHRDGFRIAVSQTQPPATRQDTRMRLFAAHLLQLKGCCSTRFGSPGNIVFRLFLVVPATEIERNSHASSAQLVR